MSERDRLKRRWADAEQEVGRAQHDWTEAITKAERKVIALRESERIAYRNVYQSVPCGFCGVAAGKACYTDWPTMHTARAADCMKPTP